MSPLLGIEHPNDFPLTPRQRQALGYIQHHLQAEGVTPTVRELMRALGAASPAVPQALLARLEAKGYITRQRSRGRESRNIRLTELGATADLSFTAQPPAE